MVTEATKTSPAKIIVYLITANGAPIRENDIVLCFSKLSDAESKLRQRAGNDKAEIKPSSTGLRIVGWERERIKTIVVI